MASEELSFGSMKLSFYLSSLDCNITHHQRCMLFSFMDNLTDWLWQWKIITNFPLLNIRMVYTFYICWGYSKWRIRSRYNVCHIKNWYIVQTMQLICVTWGSSLSIWPHEVVMQFKFWVFTSFICSQIFLYQLNVRLRIIELMVCSRGWRSGEIKHRWYKSFMKMKHISKPVFFASGLLSSFVS